MFENSNRNQYILHILVLLSFCPQLIFVHGFLLPSSFYLSFLWNHYSFRLATWPQLEHILFRFSFLLCHFQSFAPVHKRGEGRSYSCSLIFIVSFKDSSCPHTTESSFSRAWCFHLPIIAMLSGVRFTFHSVSRRKRKNKKSTLGQRYFIFLWPVVNDLMGSCFL